MVVIFVKKPNVVHIHSSKTGILGRIACKISGVKRVIYHVHGWSFSSSYGQTQQGNNPLLQPPTPININAPENEPKEAGMGTGKIIGWVLVGGVVIGLLIYALKGTDEGKTIIVKQPGA